MGLVKWTGLPSRKISPAVGDLRSSEALDERGLAGPVVADDAHDLAGHELEVAVVEGHDLAVGAYEAAGLHDRPRPGRPVCAGPAVLGRRRASLMSRPS